MAQEIVKLYFEVMNLLTKQPFGKKDIILQDCLRVGGLCAVLLRIVALLRTGQMNLNHEMHELKKHEASTYWIIEECTRTLHCKS